MADDRIQASVGMLHYGTMPCTNLREDVATIIKLLNAISPAAGGTSGLDNRLPPTARPLELYDAILRFQQVQNRNVGSPRLSEDGHVDPGDSTLERLNRMARRIGPIGPHEGPFFPPDIPRPPGERPSPSSTVFSIRFVKGISFGAAVMADAMDFQIADLKNRLIQNYRYGGVGAGESWKPIAVTAEGPWMVFTTLRPVSVRYFWGPARWTSIGGGPLSRNTLSIMFRDALRDSGQMLIDTGFTLGEGISSSIGYMDTVGDTIAR